MHYRIEIIKIVINLYHNILTFTMTTILRIVGTEFFLAELLLNSELNSKLGIIDSRAFIGSFLKQILPDGSNRILEGVQ